MAAVRARAPDAPLDRVEAAIAVGEELASGGDALIGRFVAEARDAGCSWTEIGQRMGVSKQAARRRSWRSWACGPTRCAPRRLSCFPAPGSQGTCRRRSPPRPATPSAGRKPWPGALALDPGSRARRVLASLGVSIAAIKKELECYISPGRQRRRRRGKAAAGACSFCGKPGGTGLRLVAGPGVYICAECVALCNEILGGDSA